MIRDSILATYVNMFKVVENQKEAYNLTLK